jgi:hypothetical protein
MLLAIVLNGMVGAICGLWLRVQVLVPLLAAAFVEVGIFARHATWSWALVLAVGLVCTVEIGYLAGAFLGAYWLAASKRNAERAQRGLAGYRHGKLFHH